MNQEEMDRLAMEFKEDTGEYAPGYAEDTFFGAVVEMMWKAWLKGRTRGLEANLTPTEEESGA